MTPAAITLTVFLIALALFIADFLPMGLTQVMSNTATCALFCPIGWTIAKTLGADPRAVVIAILIASSVAVCTPLAIPANSMILEPGGLRFKDFFKPGICLSALAFVVSMALLPILYPFYP